MKINSQIYEQADPSHSRPAYFLNAYAVSVIGGSEPGMGFAWFKELVKYYHVVLFTEAEFKTGLIEWVRSKPQVSCTIHFFDLGRQVRERCWNQGDWRFYLDYRRYQRAVLGSARTELERWKPRALHQLNMIGFREPGDLSLLARESGTPYIWGPVGGYNFPSGAFYRVYGASSVLKQSFKNGLNLLSMLNPRVIRAYKQADLMVLAIPPRGWLMPRILKRGETFPETFLRQDIAPLLADLQVGRAVVAKPAAGEAGSPLRLVMLGKLVPRKLVDVAIDALAALPVSERECLRIDVVGDGPSRPVLEALVERRKVGAHIRFLGALPHSQAMDRLSEADMLIHCSVDEGTSHAVIEALSVGKPVLAFDCGGHAKIARSAGLPMLRAPSRRAEAVSIMADGMVEVLTQGRARQLVRPDTRQLSSWTGQARIEELHRLMRWPMPEKAFADVPASRTEFV